MTAHYEPRACLVDNFADETMTVQRYGMDESTGEPQIRLTLADASGGGKVRCIDVPHSEWRRFARAVGAIMRAVEKEDT